MKLNNKTKKTLDFLSIRINNLTASEIIERIDECIERRTPCQIVGLNLDQAVRAIENEYVHRIFDEAEIVYTDGMPIVWLAKSLNINIRERIPGPDLMELLCKRAAVMKHRVFLLGSAPGVANQAAKKLQSRYPGFICAGTYSPSYGFEKNDQEMKKIIELLKNSRSDLLFVGLGSPKQDFFIYENMNKYNIPVSMSIGAAIDFIGGSVKRAPVWMRKYGLEWLYRLINEPQRLLRRYIYDLRIIKYYIRFKRQDKKETR